MKLNIINSGTASILLEGDFSSTNGASLSEAFSDAQNQQIENLILDFRPLVHIDNSGISAIMKSLVYANLHRLRVYSFGLSERYLQIFTLTGLVRQLTAIETVSLTKLWLSKTEYDTLVKQAVETDKSDSGWLPPVERITLTEKPKGALAANMNRRKMYGPFQGFGPLWQKTYTLTIEKPGIGAAEVIGILKNHFPEFQPDFNKFYPTSKGIQPGEVVFIDSVTPGGIVSTGVVVLYSDDTGFTFITPAGHPEAGWVSFNAFQKDNKLEVRIQGLASASDPFYEFAFRLAGSKLQETIWTHVLKSLADYLEVDDTVVMDKLMVDSRLHWNNSGNIVYNAQIRSLHLNITQLFRRK